MRKTATQSTHRVKRPGASAKNRTYGRRGARALVNVQRAFALSKTELGRLLGGVSRQAIDDWYMKGVPVRRIADVQRAEDLAKILQQRFIPERLPQIVRAPLPGLKGQSILQSLRTHGPVHVLDLLEEAFAYIPS